MTLRGSQHHQFPRNVLKQNRMQQTQEIKQINEKYRSEEKKQLLSWIL